MDPKQAGSSTKSHSPYYFQYLVRINRTSQSVICLVILLFYVPALVDLLYRFIVTGILPYSSVIKIMNTLVTSVPGVRIGVHCIAIEAQRSEAVNYANSVVLKYVYYEFSKRWETTYNTIKAIGYTASALVSRKDAPPVVTNLLRFLQCNYTLSFS